MHLSLLPRQTKCLGEEKCVTLKPDTAHSRCHIHLEFLDQLMIFSTIDSFSIVARIGERIGLC